MYRLDLTNLKTSEIKYDISRYPDGQQQVKILGYESWNVTEKGEEQVKVLHKFNISEAYFVEISARLNNFKDLELICCTVASLREMGTKIINLKTPYFLGSRSDRKFEEGSNNYLKDVICPIINSLNFESVTVLDPHSDVLEACLTNFKQISNQSLVKFAINDILTKI